MEEINKNNKKKDTVPETQSALPQVSQVIDLAGEPTTATLLTSTILNYVLNIYPLPTD